MAAVFALPVRYFVVGLGCEIPSGKASGKICPFEKLDYCSMVCVYGDRRSIYDVPKVFEELNGCKVL